MQTKTILDFLYELKSNNHKDWFHEHKKEYQKAKKAFELIVETLIPAAQQLDPSVGEIKAKDTMFRINRDIRFSKNKDPYKNNFGCFISRGGRKSPFGGYYLHIEPGASFVGGGIYCPQGPELKKLRTEIYYNAEEFNKILNDKDLKEVFGGLAEMEKLKKGPVGFPKDFEHIGLLLHKNYVVAHMLTDDALLSGGIEQQIIKAFGAMVPLNAFLNRALED